MTDRRTESWRPAEAAEATSFGCCCCCRCFDGTSICGTSLPFDGTWARQASSAPSSPATGVRVRTDVDSDLPEEEEEDEVWCVVS